MKVVMFNVDRAVDAGVQVIEDVSREYIGPTSSSISDRPLSNPENWEVDINGYTLITPDGIAGFAIARGELEVCNENAELIQWLDDRYIINEGGGDYE